MAEVSCALLVVGTTETASQWWCLVRRFGPCAATGPAFWGVATVTVPIMLAFASAFAVVVFEAFRMDDAMRY